MNINVIGATIVSRLISQLKTGIVGWVRDVRIAMALLYEALGTKEVSDSKEEDGSQMDTQDSTETQVNSKRNTERGTDGS